MIKANNPLDIGVFLMLIKNEEQKTDAQIGANVKGPLVINVQEQLGLQKIVQIKSNETEH